MGAHILSGNVFEPRALNELLPDWKERGAPLETEAGDDHFLFLTEGSSIRSPVVPPTLQVSGLNTSEITRHVLARRACPCLAVSLPARHARAHPPTPSFLSPSPPTHPCEKYATLLQLAKTLP